MADYEGIPPEVAMLATQLRHVCHVHEALQRIVHELERRALVHDRSKLSPEEFPGFARINATARNFPYGSPEYVASLRAERPTIERHTTNNSHHPEAHQPIKDMGFLDILEMVCDWYAAAATYGTSPMDLAKQRGRFDWTPEQWWLIEQVASFLSPKVPT